MLERQTSAKYYSKYLILILPMHVQIMSLINKLTANNVNRFLKIDIPFDSRSTVCETRHIEIYRLNQCFLQGTLLNTRRISLKSVNII